MACSHPYLEYCGLLPCQHLASYHNIPTTVPHSHHHHHTLFPHNATKNLSQESTCGQGNPCISSPSFESMYVNVAHWMLMKPPPDWRPKKWRRHVLTMMQGMKEGQQRWWSRWEQRNQGAYTPIHVTHSPLMSSDGQGSACGLADLRWGLTKYSCRGTSPVNLAIFLKGIGAEMNELHPHKVWG